MGANGSVSHFAVDTSALRVWPTDQMVVLESENISASECGYETVDFDRFMLIVAFGTPCAVIGILFNLLLCIVFFRPYHLRTCDLYFAVLACLDSAFCVFYIFLMTVDAVSLHYGFPRLYAVYVSYMPPLFAVAKIIQLASVYMVVAATVERFFVVSRWSDTWSTPVSNQGPNLLQPHTRLFIVVAILAASVCLKSPAFWEYTVEEKTSCKDPFGAYQVEPRLAAIRSYEIFNFYVMSVVQVFLPFVLLTFLNVGIIKTLRRRLSLAKKFLFPIRYVSEISFERGVSREKLKSATYTLVGIVTGYLISSLFNTGITVLEHTARSLLEDEEGNSYRWYTLATDISSVFTIANSCFRLPLYCVCNRAVRHEVLATLTCKDCVSDEGVKSVNEKLPLNNSMQGGAE